VVNLATRDVIMPPAKQTRAAARPRRVFLLLLSIAAVAGFTASARKQQGKEAAPGSGGADSGMHHQPATLHEAAAAGDLGAVERALAAGAADDVNSRSPTDGHTPLHVAAWRGDADLLRLLLKSGAHVRARDKHGLMPLHVAAGSGKPSSVLILAQSRGSQKGSELMEAGDKDGMTPLHHAAMNGFATVARLLAADLHADVHARDRYGATPLHIAAKQGRLDVVKMLIGNDIGADVKSMDRDGATPLHYAAVGGDGARYGAVAQALLDAGADPWSTTITTGKHREGNTALALARLTNSTEVAAILSAAQTKATAPTRRTGKRRAPKSGL
jgi:ankyrin repeat protein